MHIGWKQCICIVASLKTLHFENMTLSMAVCPFHTSLVNPLSANLASTYIPRAHDMRASIRLHTSPYNQTSLYSLPQLPRSSQSSFPSPPPPNPLFDQPHNKRYRNRRKQRRINRKFMLIRLFPQHPYQHLSLFPCPFPDWTSTHKVQ
jgi:hypothetical protein